LHQSQLEINRLSNDYTSVKTKQEQYLAFIENSLYRKQDIEQKITCISNELLASEPLLAELKIKRQIKLEQVQKDQQSYNELAESLNSKSASYNQENIRFHQQQNKVSGIDKDLEYRESQQHAGTYTVVVLVSGESADAPLRLARLRFCTRPRGNEGFVGQDDRDVSERARDPHRSGPDYGRTSRL
jgi:hypothetical protein